MMRSIHEIFQFIHVDLKLLAEVSFITLFSDFSITAKFFSVTNSNLCQRSTENNFIKNSYFKTEYSIHVKQMMKTVFSFHSMLETMEIK